LRNTTATSSQHARASNPRPHPTRGQHDAADLHAETGLQQALTKRGADRHPGLAGDPHRPRLGGVSLHLERGVHRLSAPANRLLFAYRSVERHRTLPAVERQTARTAEPPPSAPRVKPRRLRRATELRRRRKLDAHSPAVALRFLGLGCTVDA
jgi:hypothetical protein